MNGIWLLLGPEYGLQKKEVFQIKQNIEKAVFKETDFKETGSKEPDSQKPDSQKPDSDTLETQKFFVGDVDASTIASEIKSQSLFFPHRLIQIFQVDLWNASDTKIISQALLSKDDDTFVIMMSDATKIGATIEKIVPKQNKKIFWKLSDEKYAEYISQKSQSMGLEFHDEAIDSIVYISGENTLDIDNVLHQISVFINGERKKNKQSEMTAYSGNDCIMKEDIALWLSHFKHETVFKVFEDIAKAQYEKAILSLEFLIQSGEHTTHIMAGLVYQIRNALRLSQARDRGERVESMLQTLNIRNFSTQKYYKDFISYTTTDAIAMMLRVCMDTEESLRSGGDARLQSLTMSMMAYHICMLHSHPSYISRAKNSYSYYNIHKTHLYDW